MRCNYKLLRIEVFQREFRAFKMSCSYRVVIFLGMGRYHVLPTSNIPIHATLARYFKLKTMSFFYGIPDIL